ncbi:hypothetical protein D030_0665B, partial [Vibrio parahaemolyticus AQ3810]|jgi:hypothetical protein
VAKL